MQAMIANLQGQVTDLTIPLHPAVNTIAFSAVQARLVLAQANPLANVIAYMDTLTGVDPQKIFFEYSTEWRRDNRLVAQIGNLLGISNDETINSL